MTQDNTDAKTFADEVDDAIDNITESLPALDGTENFAADTKEQLVGLTDEELAADNTRGISPIREQFAEWSAKTAPAEMQAQAYPPELLATGGNLNEVPNYVPGVGFTATEPVSQQQADTRYDTSIAAMKALPGYKMFCNGFRSCLERLQNFVDEHREDDDQLAIIFNAFVNANPVSQFVSDTVTWANHQDLSDGSLRPQAGDVQQNDLKAATADAEAGSFDVMALTPDTEKIQADLTEPGGKVKAHREDLSHIDRADLENMLSESLTENERLQQQINREGQTPDLWAAITEYFNVVMAGENESELAEPLVIRIQHFVNRLRDESWQLAGFKADSSRAARSLDELPPQLSDLLKGQPESSMDLTQSQQLYSMVTRLWREVSENVEDAAKYRSLSK